MTDHKTSGKDAPASKGPLPQAEAEAGAAVPPESRGSDADGAKTRSTPQESRLRPEEEEDDARRGLVTGGYGEASPARPPSGN